MIKLPFTFTNVLDAEEVTIDLYDVAFISVESSLVDDVTGEKIDFEKECVIITMNNDSFYVADILLSTALNLSKEYWRIKTKKAFKELFKNN
ncbi:MAG: hypothetical protein ACI4BH_01950 [Muribaculaceae bacterium]